MIANANIDLSKSLAELTGVDWSPPPANVGIVMQERYEIRRTPIAKLPDTAIVRFLDMGSDIEILIPVSLERLNKDPEAVGLLCAVLRADGYDWRANPQAVAKVRDRVDMALNQICQIDGSVENGIERLRLEVLVWRHCAEFERGLSAV